MPPPRPTPPGLEAPGKVSRVLVLVTVAPCSALSSIWSSAPHPPHAYTPSCHTEAVWSCAAGLTLSLHPFVGHGVLSAGFPRGWGGPESGALLAFSRAQACGPQLLLSYCASSSHTPNPRGLWCMYACVCVRVGSELCTFREKLCWTCAGGGRVTATHSCRAGRAETQIQMSIFCCCC